MVKLLVVEDDIALCEGVALALKAENMQILTAHNINTAKNILNENAIELVVLDINLPDGNGIAFLKYIKQSTNSKVIMLTANDLESDIVLGLESGANDYITKPFSLAVLRARVNTQLRQNIPNNIFKQGNLIFDFDNLTFSVNGKNIEFSKTEQKLLKVLTDNKGITIKRENLADKIWVDGTDYVDENALSVAVKRLRDKLGKENPIKTIYGIGYTWENV